MLGFKARSKGGPRRDNLSGTDPFAQTTDRKGLLALRGVGPECEAESVRFQTQSDESGREVKYGRRRGLKIRVRGSTWPLQFGLPRDTKLLEAKTTKEQTILKRTDPAFIEPMQCKPVTRCRPGENWTFEIKFDGYRCIAVKRRVRSGGQSPCLIRPSTVSLLTIMIFLTLICLLSTSTTALPRPGISTPSTIGVPPSTSLATATMA